MTRCSFLSLWLALVIPMASNPFNSIAVEVVTLEIGASAPDFALPGVDGKTYTLNDFADAKLLMVIFTCNHCPTAQAYEERIKQLYDQYKDRGVALLAISPNDPLAVRLDELGYSDLNDSFEEMKIRAQDQDFKFPYLYDGETQETSQAFGVRATPHVFVFDADRKLRYVGRIDDNDVKPPTSHDARNALDELLAGKEVTLPTTRVFGCSTKWSDKRASARESLAKWDQEEADLEIISPQKLHNRLTEKTENFRLVNVWATWCAPCVGELEELVTMHRMYRKRPFELITVSADELSNAKAAEKMLDEKHCSATNFIVDAQTRDELFDAVDPDWQGAIPYTILIAPSGKVVHRIHDSFDPAELKKVIVENLGRTYAERN